MDERPTWGPLIRAKRGDRTQVELGAAIGAPQSLISRWESGDVVPSHRWQSRLVNELNITPAELHAIYSGQAA